VKSFSRKNIKELVETLARRIKTAWMQNETYYDDITFILVVL
jgi:hypothetical protein